MNIDDMGESRFLRAADCGEEGIRATIEHVVKQNVAPLNEPPKEKWTVHHSNGVKPFVLNKTTREQIAEILGSRDTNDWIGGQVEYYRAHNIPFKGKLVDGIRVRAAGSGRNGNGANSNEKPAPVRPHKPVPLSQPSSETLNEVNAELSAATDNDDIPF